MASTQHGGNSKVSAKSVHGSIDNIPCEDSAKSIHGEDSAKSVHGEDEYDSSSSPCILSSYGEDDSDYDEKDDQEKKESLAMMVTEVIEDISPLARDDRSASCLLDKGTFSKAPFGVLDNKSRVQILKRPLKSSGVLHSFNKHNVIEARGVGCFGEDGVALGNSCGLLKLEDGENFNLPNLIGGNSNLPIVNSKSDHKLPNQITTKRGNLHVSTSNMESIFCVPCGDNHLPYVPSSNMERISDVPCGDAHLPNIGHVNLACGGVESDLPCMNVNADSLFGSMLDGINGNGVSNGFENGKISKAINANLLAGHINMERGSDGIDLLAGHVIMESKSDALDSNLAHATPNASTRSHLGKSDLATHVCCDLNGKDQNVAIGVNLNIKDGYEFPIKAKPYMVNGADSFVNFGKSADVAKVNMESFQCDFPSLNGHVTHPLNVMAVSKEKCVDEVCKSADVARSSYAHALGNSNGIGDHFSSSQSVALQFIKPNMVDGRIKVCPPLEVAEEGSVAWRNTLVGYFVGKKLPFKVVDSIAHKIWGRYGLCEVMSSDNGFFFFKFQNFQDACIVMERGPWHMANRPLVLKHWQPSLPLAREDVNKVPVWVRLYNVPFEYWTSKGLSFVASAVGCPLHADHITLSRTRLSYARVCVEIDARDELIDDFDFQCSNGTWIKVRAEFEWVPMKCSSCGVFGHTLGSCPKHAFKRDEGAKTNVKKEESKPSTIWVPKATGSSGNMNSQVEKDAEWVTVTRKVKGKGVLKEDAMVPFKELVSDAQGQVGASALCSSKGLEIVLSEAKEDGECSPLTQVMPHEFFVNPDSETCLGEASEPHNDSIVHGVDDIAFEPDFCEDDFSPMSTINSLALKAKDSLEKKSNKAGKYRKATGGKKVRKSHSPRGGRRS